MPAGPGAGIPPGGTQTPIQRFVNAIHTAVGDPYVYGDQGPSSFDCSGLVLWAAGLAGIKGVPRTSEAQWNWVNKIKQSELVPGDLVFSQWPGDNASPGHVQVYVGNGQVIGADNSHTGVEQTPLSNDAGHIIGYGRMPGQPASIGGDTSLLPSGSLFSLALPQPILDMFASAEKVAQGLAWFVNPENWARMVSGGLGVILLIFGMVFLVRAGM